LKACGFDPSLFGWMAFSGRRESIPGGFGLDILSRTPAERHPAKQRLTLCLPSKILREAAFQTPRKV